jgi:hypothetical protein
MGMLQGQTPLQLRCNVNLTDSIGTENNIISELFERIDGIGYLRSYIFHNRSQRELYFVVAEVSRL